MTVIIYCYFSKSVFYATSQSNTFVIAFQIKTDANILIYVSDFFFI